MTNLQRGKAIRRAREKARVSPADLARACGVRRVAVYLWQSGSKRPTDGHLRAIAKAVGIADWKELL